MAKFKPRSKSRRVRYAAVCRGDGPDWERRRVTPRLVETAFHEIAHAVVAQALGVAVHEVRLLAKGKVAGYTDMSKTKSVMKDITIAVAGSIGVLMLRPTHRHPYDAGDIRAIYRLLKEAGISGEERMRMFDRAEDRACKILKEKESEVFRLADLLLACGSLFRGRHGLEGLPLIEEGA